MSDLPTPEKKYESHRQPRKPRSKERKKRERKVLFKMMQTVGFLRLLKRTRESSKVSPALRKQWLCRCEGPIVQDDGTTIICNKELVVPEMYLRRKTNPKVDCGCQTQTVKSRHNREYRIWLMIRERTRNPTHIAHRHYATRGINICEEWYDLEKGFGLFFAAVGERPTPDHSIDRIDNVRGYEPGNVRWATSQQQRANQGDMVAGYTEETIKLAGYTRREFTDLVFDGFDEDMLINVGKKQFELNQLLEDEDDDSDDA